MIQFECDYNEGAHPAIMERLVATNIQNRQTYVSSLYDLAVYPYLLMIYVSKVDKAFYFSNEI